MQDFKVGDVVRLKSGGPKMSITMINQFGIKCQWFVEVKKNQELRDGTFMPEQLVKIEDQDESRRVHRVIDSYHEID